MSFIDYRKYFSDMHGGAYRGVKLLSSPVKPKIDISLSEDNQRDIGELVDKVDKRNHSSLVIYGQRDTRKARLINHIAYETKHTVCFVSCDEFVNYYIGETDKNMSALLARAEPESWIFYLHEADTFFANSQHQTRDTSDTGQNSETDSLPTKNNKNLVDCNYLFARFSRYPCAVLMSLQTKVALQQVKHRVDYLIKS